MRLLRLRAVPVPARRQQGLRSSGGSFAARQMSRAGRNSASLPWDLVSRGFEHSTFSITPQAWRGAYWTMVSADTFESGGRRAAIGDRRDQYRSIPSSDRSNSVGAPHPEPASYAKKFSGKYSHCTITGGIGHNLPQE